MFKLIGAILILCFLTALLAYLNNSPKLDEGEAWLNYRAQQIGRSAGR